MPKFQTSYSIPSTAEQFTEGPLELSWCLCSRRIYCFASLTGVHANNSKQMVTKISRNCISTWLGLSKLYLLLLFPSHFRAIVHLHPDPSYDVMLHLALFVNTYLDRLFYSNIIPSTLYPEKKSPIIHIL